MMEVNRGAISIVALWIVAILAILALGMAHRMSIELKLTAYQVDRLRVGCLAEAGVNRALVALEKDTIPQYDALNEPWGCKPLAFEEVHLGQGTFTVGYPVDLGYDEMGFRYGLGDEEGRININTASDTLLEQLFLMIGEAESDARKLAVCIVDWRDPDSATSHLFDAVGAEEVHYQDLDHPYHCKNGEFEVIEELLLVKEITPERLARMRDFITIYGDGRVNLNTAPRNVLMALMSTKKTLVDWGIEVLVDRIIRFRKGDDDVIGTEDDGVFTHIDSVRNILDRFELLPFGESAELDNLKNSVSVNSRHFRIHSVGLSGDGKVSREITVVVERGENNRSKILFWHEE